MRILLTIFLFQLITWICFGQENQQIQLANEYYIKGELAKAKELYKELARDRKNILIIHNNYFNILINTKDFETAEKYLEKTTRIYPDNILFEIDLGILFFRKGQLDAADRQFNQIIKQVERNQSKLRLAAQYFMNHQFPDYALKAFKQGRKYSGDDSFYSLEMANIYRVLNDRNQMVEEYLNYVDLHPRNLNYVKNILQNLLNEEEDLSSLETILYSKIQKSPNKTVYNELLIWVNLQQKNFNGAFVQAKALDRRLKSNGEKSMEIGRIALENKDYTNAIKIFDYLVQNYQASLNYIVARKYLINAKEEKIKNTFPINELDIQELINSYQELIDEIGITRTTLEALRNKALLHAFYLDQKETAIQILNQIIKTPQSGPRLIASSKLDLGDIYLFIEEPWESTLLYSQVEKANKETPLGYEAKLRNAKLHYFKGDFALAQSHLDILKEATTREISNDAIALSLLIKANTYLDSNDLAMKEYASIELLLFQNKADQALERLDSLLVSFPSHSLIDEIYWLKAKIFLERGEFEHTISLLERIINEFEKDILSDDAYFLIGNIYEEHTFDKEKAMEIYQNFLTRYPGSIYTSEARKRFRKLRGDLL